MPRSEFKGSWTALITPFKEDGSVDFEGLEKNILFQIDQGITGVLAVGTTGESPTLSTPEHIKVIARANEFAGGRCGVLAGTGSNCTDEALAHTKHALESGVNKVLLVDCYYNGPSSLELRDEYYKAVLDEYSDVEVVIYVIPGRTGTAISTVDIAVLAGEYDRVIAIKEATGDLQRMEDERALMPEISIMSGDDDKTFEMMKKETIRAQGVISVVTNIAPKAVTRMVDALLSDDRAAAESLAKKLKPLFSIVTIKAKAERTLPNGKKVAVEDRFRNPLATKTVMEALGMASGPTRRPIGKMTPAGVEIARSAVREVYENSPEILEPIASFYDVDIEERINDDGYWKPLSY
ncbi:MAG: 4-hydroxy-tetrahydrodipicolinate synthase [Spirochaetes bacterium]|nr:4-hydroxy-tetrahydrodipicolinate synthase [Spirochaetota bacterium]